MSSAYALPLDQQIKARDSSRNSNSTKSLVLSILMISMSLSTGIIEVNQPTSNLEESPAEFDASPDFGINLISSCIDNGIDLAN